MSDNMKLWESVCKTDPSAVKAITGKQYKGNSPKPYWIVQKLTETFGPCGIGWGIEIVNERYERFDASESLHVALVRVWYVFEGKRGQIEQMGQTRGSYVTSNGRFLVDEDAPKKSVTDGMVKCFSLIGFAGDIFSGRWDDSKYVQELREEEAQRGQPEPPANPSKPKPTPEQKAARIEKGVADGMATEAAAHLAGLPEAELHAIWALIAPDTQKTITANWPQ